MAKVPLEELRRRQRAALGKNGETKPAAFSGRAPEAEGHADDDQAITNEVPVKAPAAAPAPAKHVVRKPIDDTRTSLHLLR